MSLPEALRLVAQTIATLVEGVGIAIVAVAVVLASVRYVSSPTRSGRQLPPGMAMLLVLQVRLPSGELRAGYPPATPHALIPGRRAL
jgi:hypothetical protein